MVVQRPEQRRDGRGEIATNDRFHSAEGLSVTSRDASGTVTGIAAHDLEGVAAGRPRLYVEGRQLMADDLEKVTRIIL